MTKAQKALIKKINSLYTPDEQDDIGFYPDVEGEKSYIMRLNVDGQNINFEYDYATAAITVQTV